MATPYSVSFMQIPGLSGTQVVVIPAGYVAVVRCIDTYGRNSTVTPNHLTVQGSNGQAFWGVQVDPNSARFDHWEGRQVFNPGGTFDVTTDAPFDVTVSGYLLTV